MIDFTINTDTFFLPTSWAEVKYTQYQEITALETNEDLSGTDKAMQIIAILTKVPLETLEAAGFGLVVPLFNHLDFIKTIPEALPMTHVSILGVNYYAQDIETMGELAAFDKVNTHFGDDEASKLPFILAILLRKRVQIPGKQVSTTWIQHLFGTKTVADDVEIQYESFENDFKTMEKRAKLFASQLSPAEIMGLSAFFLQKEQASRSVSANYSEAIRSLPVLKKLSDDISAKSTGGWRPSSIWNRMYSVILRCYVWTLTQSLQNSNTTRK